ncbi:MAG TPA: AmmeMemoRadiSam system radical SAM enzyme [Candidatus Omnitrophota bacterium]|nr:AmmeMemoRadiSam system radical SAM enzyme [Candidatus Omnitrophota bacterium]HQQ06970.1 AmmeMemoRadiSam system radical SAM enzyme [Candidatus Omnitrophota bacterium]
MKKSLLFLILLLSVLFPAIGADQPSHEASFYEKLRNTVVNCRLCPRECVIPDGKRGYCRVRENRTGVLYALSYGQPVAVHTDPIEKKPFFHFLPSSEAFSIATVGCNMNCAFCQNWEISQAKPEDARAGYATAGHIVTQARRSGAQSIAFTYTEPTIFYEYMLDIARKAKAAGLRVTMHSNGFINEEPLRQLCKYLDAANIDLKGFTQEYYAKVCEGSLEPVLRSLKVLREEGVHLEITNLVLSGYNDDPQKVREMCVWIRDNLGADTPMHFSRFYPMYKLLALIATPVEKLEAVREIALDAGLKYVYIGNIPGHEAEHTYCPACRNAVIRRSGYIVSDFDIVDGRCKYCGEPVKGVWR